MSFPPDSHGTAPRSYASVKPFFFAAVLTAQVSVAVQHNLAQSSTRPPEHLRLQRNKVRGLDANVSCSLFLLCTRLLTITAVCFTSSGGCRSKYAHCIALLAANRALNAACMASVSSLSASPDLALRPEPRAPSRGARWLSLRALPACVPPWATSVAASSSLTRLTSR